MGKAEISTDSLLANLDWDGLDQRVRSQQRNREVHTPAISTFRWWARRSHALIGELLDSVPPGVDDYCVSDPFSGGGTVAIEAARRGFNMVAQDLHPWAVAGLGSTLTPIDSDRLERDARRLLMDLEELRGSLYRTHCPVHGEESEVLTGFWVRVAACPACEEDIYLFPYSLVTRASRDPKEPEAWWGCSACGDVTKSERNGAAQTCHGCGVRLASEDEALLPGRQATCPHGDCTASFGPFEGSARWRMVLVQRNCRDGELRHGHFGPPTDSEIRQASPDEFEVPMTLQEPIPAGLETRVLHRSGFEYWADLYTPRQLTVLGAATPLIERMRTSAAVRARLKLALCGCAEMAGRVSRWDRYYPKAFEAMANHRFAITGLSVETNLLAERGRGTLPRRLGHSTRAARWVRQQLPEEITVRRLRSDAKANRVHPDGVVLTEGSSERQRAATGSIDLVLTDPPYFDDVQYAELAGVFLAWARETGLVASTAELDLGSEAVANVERGVGVTGYRDLLTAILSETRRTLVAEGRLVMTFHNSDSRAWWALGCALARSQFTVVALAVSHSENERDHAKRGKLAFSRDLVIECRPSRTSTEQRAGEPEVVWEGEGAEAKELIAAGRTIATMRGDEEVGAFQARFGALRGNAHPQRISPRRRLAAPEDGPVAATAS
jgi:16S rRNA G966 N2-methylase RsmD